MESLAANITDTFVYLDFSTVLHLAVEVETESTSKVLRMANGSNGMAGPTSTAYLAKVVEYNSQANNQVDTIMCYKLI